MNRHLIHRHPALVKVKQVFKGHAKPWSFKPYETLELGERIQLDHMIINNHGKTLQHFQF